MYWKVNKETWTLELETAIILEVKEFKKLISRIKTMPGDAAGRYKKLNMKEFLYVFFMSEWTAANILAALPDDERHEKAVMLCDMPDGWEPDAVVEQAIDRYIWMQTQLSPTAKTLIAAKRTLYQMSTAFKIIEKQNGILINIIEKHTEKLQFTNDDDGDVNLADTLNELNSASDALQNNMVRVTDNVKRIEDSLKRLNTLEETVKNETKENAAIYGNRILGNREEINLAKRRNW